MVVECSCQELYRLYRTLRWEKLRILSDSACITLDPKGGRVAEALLRGVAELTSSPEMEESSPWQKVWQALWSHAIHFLERNSCKFIL